MVVRLDALQIEPSIGTLRVVGGTRADAAPCAAMLTPSPRAARGREGEQLFILLDLTGPASPRLYRELREAAAQAYWSTAGSITAALRQAAVAANRHLFQINLHAAPSDRCHSGFICAVIRGDDLFVLRAGSAQACVLHGRHRLECFSRDEELPPLGMGAMADVRLHHTFVAIGDTLLLASLTLMREAESEAIARALLRADVQEVVERLEQVGTGADFAALVARLAVKPAAAQAEVPAVRKRRWPFRRSRISTGRRRETSASSAEARPVARPVKPRKPPAPKPQPRPKPVRRPGPSLVERVKGGALAVGRGFSAVGRGIFAAGVWVAGELSALVRRMLPGPEREAHRRARKPRPIPKENRTVMMLIAIGIPVLLAIVVVATYTHPRFGEEERFQSYISRAEEEVALAQAAGIGSEESRPHWEAALAYASTAVEWRPDDPKATALQTQAQAALDALDGIVRLTTTYLWGSESGGAPRRLVVHGQMIFVLDPVAGWVAQLTLNPTGDGVVEEVATRLVHTGQQIDGQAVGKLVDFAWVEPGGERQTSGLLILEEEDGALVSYDPAWEGEEGAPHLTRSFLGTPPSLPRAVGSFEGRFYILDADANQIRRYEPRGDTYPEQPDNYFTVSPPRPLGDVLDMAIDGNIYLLYTDGAILKFLGGEAQSFDVRSVPGGIGQAVALAVDSGGSSGAVYVADRGSAEDQGIGRVVVLEPDGAFRAQLHAGEAFAALEALAVDEAAGRLYVFSGGRLYAASLTTALP